MEVLNLLDKLESIVTTSGRIPATKKAIVDIDRLLDVVDQIRLALPQGIQEADEILMKRESVVNHAVLEARRIKSEAENELRGRLTESNLVKEATQKAEEVLADAKRRADMLLQDSQRKAHQLTQEAEGFAEARTDEANHYTQETLLKLEQQLSSLLNSIRRGLDALDTPAKTPANGNGRANGNGHSTKTKNEAAVS
ncbi:MAG: hypothetical protein EXR48_02330 [Dehalococcoidia bacterium]|nr:hypothetical protein [Dehalococcoidia bacterium]